jgi:hypothetical protein
MDVNQTGATYLYHKDKHYDTSFDYVQKFAKNNTEENIHMNKHKIR